MNKDVDKNSSLSISIRENRELVERCIMRFLIIMISFGAELINHNQYTILAWDLLLLAIFFFVVNFEVEKKIAMGFMAFFGIMVVFVFESIQYYKSIVYISSIVLMMGLSFCIFYALVAGQFRANAYMIKWFVICGTILATMTIIESLVSSNVFFERICRYSSRDITFKEKYVCFGSFGNHLVLSFYLQFVLLLTVFYYREIKKKLIAMAVFIQIVGIISVGARSAYLSLGVLVMWYLGRRILYSVRRKKITRKMQRAMMFLCVFVVLLYTFRNHISVVKTIAERFSSLIYGTESASLRHRLSTPRVVLSYWKRSNTFIQLFGAGVGVVGKSLETNSIASTQMSAFYVIDNQWASLLFDVGVFGTIGVLYIWARVFFAKSVKGYGFSTLLQGSALLVFIYMFSFDIMTWCATSMIIGVILSMYRARNYAEVPCGQICS